MQRQHANHDDFDARCTQHANMKNSTHDSQQV
jgi:hypothetical protein